MEFVGPVMLMFMSKLFFLFIYLFFALNLAANQEYYHQWNVEECHGCSLDLSTFTVEELDNITSEYTLNNTVR